MRFRTTQRIFLLIAAAVALRVLFAGAVVGWDRAPIGDEVDYHAIAASLARGDGFAVDGAVIGRRPPLYPAFLGVVYRVTGPSVTAGRFAQVALGGAIIGLVFLVARRFFPPATAWIAAALAAANPFLIFASGYLLTENLYITLILASLVIMPRPGDGECSPRRAAALGALFGLAALTRPTAAGLGLVAVGLVALFQAGPARRRVLRAAAVLGMMALVILPWASRNHAVFGKWILFSTHGGITFYQGNNASVLETPQYHGGVAPLYALPGYDTLKNLPPVEKDKAAWSMGRRFLGERKRDVPRLLWRKFARFWRFRSDAGLSGIKSGWWWNKNRLAGRLASTVDVGSVYAVLVIPLFALGMGWVQREWRALALLYAVVVVHTLAALVFFGSLRMRLPVEPVMAVFAAEAARRLVLRMRRRAASSIGAGVGGPAGA